MSSHYEIKDTTAIDFSRVIVTGVTIDESNLVHKTGTETITGLKTLDNDLIFMGISRRVFGYMGGDAAFPLDSQRMCLKNSHPNGNSIFGVVPNGTARNAALRLWSREDIDNSEGGGVRMDNANLYLETFKRGTAPATFPIMLLADNQTIAVFMPITFLSDFRGDIQISTVGKKLLVKEGSNASMGVATLVAGTAIVPNTLVTANSRIFVCGQNAGGTIGEVSVISRNVGVSFTLNSTSGTDTRTIAWLIIEPAP